MRNKLFVLLLAALTSTLANADIIHQEKSLYRNIFVEDRDNLRCLKFNVKDTLTHQSCMLKMTLIT